MSYSQPIDLSSLLKTGGLGQYNAAASQDLKSAIGIGGGKSGGDYSSGPSLSYNSGSGSNIQLSSVPGSAFKSPTDSRNCLFGVNDNARLKLSRLTSISVSKIGNQFLLVFSVQLPLYFLRFCTLLQFMQ